MFVYNEYSLAKVEHGNYPRQEPPNRRRFGTDPFVRRMEAFGPGFLHQVWLHGLTGPPRIHEEAFVGVLNAGICTGLAATVGDAYERFRLGLVGDVLGQRPVEAVLDMALRAQLQVLTAEFLLHCKWFLIRHPRETVTWLTQAAAPGFFRPLLVLVPEINVFDVDGMKARLVHAHSVFLHSYTVSPVGIRGWAWDPNFPDQGGREIQIGPEGDFTYRTSFGLDCLLTSQPAPDTYGPLPGNAGPSPTQLGRFRLVPVPLGLLFPSALRPMANVFDLIFG